MDTLLKVRDEYCFQHKETGLYLSSDMPLYLLEENELESGQFEKKLAKKNQQYVLCNKKPYIVKEHYLLIIAQAPNVVSKVTLNGLYVWLGWKYGIGLNDKLFTKLFKPVKKSIYETPSEDIDLTDKIHNISVKCWLERNIKGNNNFVAYNLPAKIDYRCYHHVLLFKENNSDNYVSRQSTIALRADLKQLVKNTDYRSSKGIFFFKDENHAMIAKLSSEYDDVVYVNLGEIDLNKSFESY